MGPMPRIVLVGCAALIPCAASAQSQPVTQQIEEALSPLPENLRAGATVLGYREGTMLQTIRQGDGEMICLADDPDSPTFHVACYHEGLEPMMARGRELRAEGKSGVEVNEMRDEEIRSGKIPMPERAALYSLTGPINPATGKPDSAAALYVIYVPFATEETTGFSAQPSRDRPWLMFPGAPRAHVMIRGGWIKP